MIKLEITKVISIKSISILSQGLRLCENSVVFQKITSFVYKK